jgi:DNA segregation ATPase FtsK/SpoIIIE-like protein
VKKEEVIILRISEEERKRIYEKMAEIGVHNMSAYIRKMALDGYCIQLDLKDIKELTYLLQRCVNNLNQYAKRANADGSIYQEDIKDLQEQFAVILRTSKEILEVLSTVR